MSTAERKATNSTIVTLYDRHADSYETVDLLSHDASARIGAEPGEANEIAGAADEMRQLLLGWLADTSDVIPWERHPRNPPISHGYRED